MDSFLKQVALEILNKHRNFENLIIIVPSKRAGIFLQRELLKHLNDTVLIAPVIQSIEEFISKLSGLNQIDNLQVLFEFYNTYLDVNPEQEKESFDTFIQWAQTLIHDFNEIDRYLIDHHSFFNYLANIQDLNHWYLKEEKTTLINNYISFWNSLYDYYTHFTEQLKKENKGYQGLIYREAAEGVYEYASQTISKHIFLGFNALNNAEQRIFNVLLDKELAEIFWDTDQYFIDNNHHEAALFLRKYKEEWNYFHKNPFDWVFDHFKEEKKIHCIACSKNVGQAKAAGKILEKRTGRELESTALVLADESLLLPVMNSLPTSIPSLNITMGLPLRDVPLASFFDLLFSLHRNRSEKGFYYKTVLDILNSQTTFWLLGNQARALSSKITKENRILVNLEYLLAGTNAVDSEIIKMMFGFWKDPKYAIDCLQTLIIKSKEVVSKGKDTLSQEYLFRFHTIFNSLKDLVQRYSYVSSLSILYNLYKEILQTETLDFLGEPFEGLQLMGMLESRCLDFETVIITSVNEGILPAGKSTNSFIPYDLKIAYGLPTYREKDAIYTYHFYRLIQRAKKVFLLYNTENEGVGGGEKSRFIRQIETDQLPNHKIVKTSVSTAIPKIETNLRTIEKTEAIQQKLKELAQNGFSPSALTTYIRNPIDFYNRYILGIKELEEVEEMIAANTLGTIVHDTLEVFYEPFIGKYLTVEDITAMKQKIKQEVIKQVKTNYSDLDITQGKNFLILSVAIRYISRFLEKEKKSLIAGNSIKILAIENTLKTKLEIPDLDFPIYLKGKVDRVDSFNDQIRIIDYKTGKVTANEIIVQDWDMITTDYKYSKIIQVLSYAYMIKDQMFKEQCYEAGIISFKNLNEGFLRFGKKEKVRGPKIYEVNNETLNEFTQQLNVLIKEIFSLDKDFIEKEL